jgi:hypothetical protein
LELSVVDEQSFFKEISKHPDRFYLIHYSSERLFDETVGALSPRITSIVVMHYQSRQIQSFALHAVAETLNIPRENVADRYDDIERDLLTRFFDFIRDRRQSYWVHWNMRSLVYGFEHLEHRYRILTGHEPPIVPIEVRLNLNDIFKVRYGSDYAADPRLKSLMALQGDMPAQFMEGAEESEAFRRMEFIRMNASTIAKVQFFRHAVELAKKGRLRTAGNKLVNRIDKLLESRWARVLAFTGTCLALMSWLAWLIVSMAK